MQEMTHKERVMAALNNEPVDRLPYQDTLWSETVKRYEDEGQIRPDEDLTIHFDMSFQSGGWLNSMADLDFEEQILEETDETKLTLNGNGAKLRHWKAHSGTPEHVDFTVKDRSGWEALIKPHLLEVDRRRIPFEDYRKNKQAAARDERAFCWAGVAPFEQMHPVCGHEYMLMGMALDPNWVKDMVTTYANFTLMHLETLFTEEGRPDFLFFYEDMGFKEKPFMSPGMYEEIVQPGHARLFDFAHSQGCKVMVHSCGFVEPLVPGLIAAGMDCLQAMEVKAGMDLPHLAERFGDKTAFCGGLDIREIASNDTTRIDAEMRKKLGPVLQKGCGYILHSDHSIPPQVNYESLRYFFERGSHIRDWI